jgi:hypothetical protein
MESISPVSTAASHSIQLPPPPFGPFIFNVDFKIAQMTLNYRQGGWRITEEVFVEKGNRLCPFKKLVRILSAGPLSDNSILNRVIRLSDHEKMTYNLFDKLSFLRFATRESKKVPGTQLRSAGNFFIEPTSRSRRRVVAGINNGTIF